MRYCGGCQETANNPARAPLHQWDYPALPWQRLHIDFAGPVYGKMLMVIIDAHSKWREVFVMDDTTAEGRISTLCSLFARLGVPDQIVPDNSSHQELLGSLQLPMVLKYKFNVLLVHPTTQRPTDRQKNWYRVSRKE